jgi:hypothetical protein
MHLFIFGSARKLSGLALVALALISSGGIAQESQSQDPAPVPSTEEATSQPAGEPSSDPADEKLTVDEMKSLSDDDLRALYLEEPWRLPEDFGDDEELLERVMSLIHPEMEPASETSEHPEETEQAQTTETTPKPKPQPDAR